MEAFLWPPLMRGLSAVRLTGGEKTVGDRRRGGLWPPAGARCAPLRMMTHPMWRGLLDAPYLPPGGKVAFAEQMTDEGATCLPPCRGAPMCAPRTGGRTRRSAPTDNAPPAWVATVCRGHPAGAPYRQAAQQGQILDRERQRAGKQFFFKFAPARRMSKRRQGAEDSEGKFLETVGF